MTDVERIREKIAELKNEREKILKSPIPVDWGRTARKYLFRLQQIEKDIPTLERAIGLLSED